MNNDRGGGVPGILSLAGLFNLNEFRSLAVCPAPAFRLPDPRPVRPSPFKLPEEPLRLGGGGAKDGDR